MRTLRHAALYAALLFGAGFVLGTIRNIVLIPQIGVTPAVLAELPFMLAIAWFVARSLVRRLRPNDDAGSNIAVGLIGFVLLQAAELALGVFGFGLSLDAIASSFETAHGMAGLAAQLATAFFPALVKRI
ncbi:MAG TPA: hypothetical protein PKE65_05855 [Rhizobiaceae bacterium]|nr:hypothetical protein [Rhizobiaceae bacterium]